MTPMCRWIRPAEAGRHVWFGHYVFMAICLVPTANAFADHVTLKNGDGLTGRITSTSPTELTIDTDLAGRVTIQWSAVSRVTPPAAVPAGVTLGAADTPPASATSTGWEGTVNAGVDVSHGNTETRAISTNGTMTRLGPHDRLGMFGTHLSSSVGSGADAVTTARATRGGLRYDHDLHGSLFGFGFLDAENDVLQLLDLRTVGGGGAGMHLFRNGATQLNGFGGVSYARDAYTAVTTDTTTTTTTGTTTSTTTGGPPATTPGKGGTPPGQGGTPPGQTRLTRGGTPPAVVRSSLTRNVGEFLIGEDLTRQWSGNLGISEGFTVYPAVGDVVDYRASFDFSLWAQLSGWLQWNVSIADRYLHIPPAGGAVQNDTFVWTGLGITFGRGNGGAYTGTDGRRTPRARP
jgi:Protein of unknown function, DUF481